MPFHIWTKGGLYIENMKYKTNIMFDCKSKILDDKDKLLNQRNKLK